MPQAKRTKICFLQLRINRHWRFSSQWQSFESAGPKIFKAGGGDVREPRKNPSRIAILLGTGQAFRLGFRNPSVLSKLGKARKIRPFPRKGRKTNFCEILEFLELSGILCMLAQQIQSFIMTQFKLPSCQRAAQIGFHPTESAGTQIPSFGFARSFFGTDSPSPELHRNSSVLHRTC